MKDSLENKDELIAKVLAGEADKQEANALNAWLAESDKNQQYFEDTKKMLATIETVKIDNTVNVDAAWDNLNQRILNTETKTIPLFKRASILRVAAAILLLASLGIVIKWVFNVNSTQPVILLATTKPLQQKLPDGSAVFINKHSEISYTLNKKNEREVKLKGEAYFEVLHNEQQAFVIAIDDIRIKDIGTAFNVKAMPASNEVEVFVESGEVRFYTATNEGISLIKGEKAVYDKTTKLFSKSIVTASENAMSYKSKVFHFKATTLKEVIAQINAVYESDIRLNDERMGACRLSVTFNNESVEMMVAIIAETLNLETKQMGKTILLEGQPCNK
jgi:transmembrane sensor